jgi:hypothetical protein
MYLIICCITADQSKTTHNKIAQHHCGSGTQQSTLVCTLCGAGISFEHCSPPAPSMSTQALDFSEAGALKALDYLWADVSAQNQNTVAYVTLRPGTSVKPAP